MSQENNKGAAPQSPEDTQEDTIETENINEVEAQRAKTPLELVKERQAKMRGQQSTSGHASKENQTVAANSYKRRQHQRRAG